MSPSDTEAKAEPPLPNIQDVGTGDTREKPIKLGGALFTMVEPHRGHEVEYNRWYERDHFYAGCMIGAWTISGGGWCPARRSPWSDPRGSGSRRSSTTSPGRS